MKRLIRLLRRLSVSSSSYRWLRAAVRKEERRGQWRPEVPEGHVPVCVGEEMDWFAVRAELLYRPAFLELLARAAEEYGYEQRGVLRIPCPVLLFQSMLAATGGDYVNAGDIRR